MLNVEGKYRVNVGVITVFNLLDYGKPFSINRRFNTLCFYGCNPVISYGEKSKLYTWRGKHLEVLNCSKFLTLELSRLVSLAGKK